MTDLFWNIVFQMQEYFLAGKIMMLPLALCSVCMWAVFIRRSLYLKQLHHQTLNTQTAAALIQRNELPDSKTHRDALATLTATFIKKKSGRPQLDKSILEEAELCLCGTFEKHIALVGMFAGISPLLGLLGTVLGMIHTFDTISVLGTRNTRAMAEGISEALVATLTGIFIAIPGIYMHHLLVRRAGALKKIVASHAMYLKNHLWP